MSAPGRRAPRREGEKSYVHNIPAARRLRRDETETEGILWHELRGGKLQGLKFRPQHAIGRFVVDFYCDDYRLAVEIDGGVHLDPGQQARDCERQALIEERDIAFVRVSDDQVARRLPETIELIRRTAFARGSFSSPPARTTPPLPQRREPRERMWGPGGEG